MSNSTGHHTDMSKEKVTLAVAGTVIYIGGFAGNLLSLIIFTPVKIRRVSTGLLFLVLTLSNNIQLLALFVEFLDFTYGGKERMRCVTRSLNLSLCLQFVYFIR